MAVPKYPSHVVLQIQVQPNPSIFWVISCNNFWKFLILRNSAGDFLGVNFLVQPGIFLGFVGSPRDFFGF